MTPWTVARQAPLSVEYSRQEYCSGLPFPSPGNLPHPGIEPISPTSPALAGRFFTSAPPGKPTLIYYISPRYIGNIGYQKVLPLFEKKNFEFGR